MSSIIAPLNTANGPVPTTADYVGRLHIVTSDGSEWFAGDAASAVPTLAPPPEPRPLNSVAVAESRSVSEVAMPADVISALRGARTRKQPKVRAAARQEAPPVHKVFIEATKFTTDPFWIEVFTRMSRNVYKRGFRFTASVKDVCETVPESSFSGKFVYKSKSKETAIMLSSVPEEVFAQVKTFMEKKAGITSEIDQERAENELACQYENAARQKESDVTNSRWSTLVKGSGNAMSLITHFVDRTVTKRGFGDSYARSLAHALFLYTISGIARDESFLMRNGAIERVYGLHRSEGVGDRYYFDLRALSLQIQKRVVEEEKTEDDATATISGTNERKEIRSKITTVGLFPCGVHISFIAATNVPFRNSKHGLPEAKEMFESETLAEDFRRSVENNPQTPTSASTAHTVCYSSAIESAEAQVLIESSRNNYGKDVVSKQFPNINVEDFVQNRIKSIPGDIAFPIVAATRGYCSSVGVPISSKIQESRVAASSYIKRLKSDGLIRLSVQPEGIERLTEAIVFSNDPEAAAEAMTSKTDEILTAEIDAVGDIGARSRRVESMNKTALQRNRKASASALTAAYSSFRSCRVGSKTVETPSSLAGGSSCRPGNSLRRWKKLAACITAGDV